MKSGRNCRVIGLFGNERVAATLSMNVRDDNRELEKAIDRARQGDPAGFDSLVTMYAARLFGFVHKLTGNREDAEELVQEVFLRVVRRMPEYRHDGRFEPWLFRIAVNVARDRMRLRKRHPDHDAMPMIDGDRPAGGTDLSTGSRCPPAPDTGLTHQDDVARLNEALDRLPEAEREVIMLRHYGHLTFAEIAELTGVPLGTALARSHRGLGRLRNLMEAETRDTEAQPDSSVSDSRIPDLRRAQPPGR